MSIEIQNLNKYFKKVHALKGLTLTFLKNRISGLIGFNGSGKTTTFNILANFIEDYTGKILVDGKPITKQKLKTFSYLAAGSEYKNNMIAQRHLIAISKLYGLSKKDAIIKIQNFSQQIDFSHFLKWQIRKLSKGNQQKLKIIAVLLNPKLEYLLLDEPFDGLDPIMIKKVQEIFISLKNVTIIITSHRMDIVENMCQEFYILKEGVLIDSKKVSDKEILIVVNNQVSIDNIRKLNFIKSIKTNSKEHEIIIDNIKNFKNLNSILTSDKNYLYSSVKEKSIAKTIFERYN